MLPTHAEIILPLAVASTYTYYIPDDFRSTVVPGMRVIVPVGNHKFYTGLIYKLFNANNCISTKPITAILEKTPILFPRQFLFWEWITSYYQCSLNDIYRAAIPSGMKLESESIVSLKESFNNNNTKLTKTEQVILSVLEAKKEQSIEELEKSTGIKSIFKSIKSLQDKQLVNLNEIISDSYTAKSVTCIRAGERLKKQTEEEKTLFFKNKKKQFELLTIFETLSKKNDDLIEKKVLLEKSGISDCILRKLIKDQFLETYDKKISRLPLFVATQKEVQLTDIQLKTTELIEKNFEKKDVVLLHGITSSGKTEIYIHLIKKALRENKQVLYLVPEIALTTQLSNRLKSVFGSKLCIYHSKYTNNERVEIWQQQLGKNKCDIVLGTRSSVFMPFVNLGLVIVDEEHEPSYKQHDPSPRYHARDAAIVLASFFKAKTILGTATPSIESYSNAITGKYGLVELNQRHGQIQTPRILTVDLKQTYHRKQMRGHFSLTLLQAVNDTLSAGEQVILFQNRRGFAPYTECKNCYWVPRCPNCDVSMTYHKKFNRLSCHYCGYSQNMPEKCPSCNHNSLQTHGFGTEQIEQEVKDFFHEYNSVRMDFDTVQSRSTYEKILAEFESGKAKILIGTQMISKGLNFANVGLVGILNADNLLNYPDFRAHEHTFQMLTQVAGRAGRRNKQGLVILQTSSPELPIIQHVVENNYADFFKQQISERAIFHYPPFYRLIVIYIKHNNLQIISNAVQILYYELKRNINADILGPNSPPVGRVQNVYIKQILLKFNKNMPIKEEKQKINEIITSITQTQKFGRIRIYLDVDPMR